MTYLERIELIRRQAAVVEALFKNKPRSIEKKHFKDKDLNELVDYATKVFKDINFLSKEINMEKMKEEIRGAK